MSSKRKTKTKTRQGPGKKLRGQAARADRHRLYERCVQSPDADAEQFADIYRDLRGKEPRRLREDFCGTANLSAAWCRADERNRAIGVDLDGPTLAYGLEHHVGEDIADRIELHEANVMDLAKPRADITCAMNFSFCVFHERSQMLDYFKHARRGLKTDGILILEMYGGDEAMCEIEDRRDMGDFEYVWTQEYFDPLTHRTRCHISFEFDDGSKLENAFTYDWRWWSVPELRDLLIEAGFSEVRLYWEDMEEDEDGDLVGNGEYVEVTEQAENQESWLVHLVALR